MRRPRRPSTPAPVGAAPRCRRPSEHRVRLRYAGATYDLWVYRTSPGTFRVRSGKVNADLEVDFVNAYERRVRCAGHRHRVVAVTQGAMFRIVVDGTTHRVTRDDGGVVQGRVAGVRGLDPGAGRGPGRRG